MAGCLAAIGLILGSAGAEEGLVLRDRVYLGLPEPTPQLLQTGVEVLRQRVVALTEGAIAVEVGEGAPQLSVTIADARPVASPLWTADQSYALSCDASGARVNAANALGALYGLMALPALLSQDEGGAWRLPVLRSDEAPDLLLRAAHMTGLPRSPLERRAWCRRLAALRLNALVVEDDIWWRLDDPIEREAAAAACADLRAHGIEPVPELPCLGRARALLALEPMCAEGSVVRRERLALSGDRPTVLARPNVLRTGATDIRLEDAQGRPYAMGRDYEVLDGETRYPYRPEATLFRVRRLPGGHIPDGGEVLASYDYVSCVNDYDVPYCPSEPRVAEVVGAALRNTLLCVKPAAVHLGYTRPALMNSDSRCLSREPRLTSAQLLAEDMQRLHGVAREIDPDVRVMVWADAVDPYHAPRALARAETAAALSLLPRDVILNTWFYGSDQPDREGAESLRYFGALG
ncbi:MAG: hypothetical protein FJX74_20880, partial [Armatimonadetes bacterium]|nr:hypothetical protein [Armatimonadota bacterium]